MTAGIDNGVPRHRGRVVRTSIVRLTTLEALRCFLLGPSDVVPVCLATDVEGERLELETASISEKHIGLGR
jgi:hypothetical protein